MGAPWGSEQGGVRVLLVDDEVALCHTWERILGRHGYTVRSVHHGDQVLAAVRDFRPAVVVLDVKLPGVDGITLCRRLKEDPETARVRLLLCSGHMDVDLELARGLADSVARKPVPPDLLLASLAVLAALEERTLAAH